MKSPKSFDMTYALTAIILAQVVLIGYLIREGREEREDLEDRIMAISQPVALVTKQMMNEPASVTYVDEAREAELSPSRDGGKE